MEAFHTHTGIGVPLRRSNVDTDQIIPAVYLKRVTRTGFEDGLFASWRADPSFVLNLSPFDKARSWSPDPISAPDRRASMRSGRSWTTDSGWLSHLDSATFSGAIAGKAGLLAAEVAQDDVELLWKLIEQSPGLEITVNLQDRNITAGTAVLPFKIDDYTAWRLLEGLDDIGLTLRKLDEIELIRGGSPGLETAHSARLLTGWQDRMSARSPTNPSPFWVRATGQGRQPDCENFVRCVAEIARGSWKSAG